MRIGVVADDFTGAADIANTLAKASGGARGFATTQFIGVPDDAADPACEAGVVALKSRSIPADQAVAQSLAALRWLQQQGCRQIVFKYCSTFDSTHGGNIGPVAEALADALDVSGVVVCPAFPATGRTVYRGNLFVGDLPLAETGMRKHPLTPMTDSDIRRWLRAQAKHPVGSISWHPDYGDGASLRAALTEAASRGERLVVVDAITEADLIAIGSACADAPLLTGGSGIALGLARNYRDRLPVHEVGLRPQAGPEAVFAGSCSQATLQQISIHKTAHPSLQVSVAAVMEGGADIDGIVAFVLGHTGRNPLVYSSDAPELVASVQERYGANTVAAALDAVFASVATRLVAGGVARLVVAGGETSGAVVSALGLRAMSIGPEIDPGVPAVSAIGGPPLALALKSGNFGGPDFFARACRMLGGERP